MKKIVYSLFLILTGVATLVSCQKDEADFSLSAVIADKPEVVSNPNAKAYIEEVNSVYYARWHNGDIVNINNQPCTLSVSSTSAAAVINNITLSGSGYTAVYPYGAGALDGTTATVTIPATQTYHTAQANGSSGASYQVVDGPMVARCASGDNVLRFHNAAGIIRVHVNNTTAETLKVHYVSVESSDGSYLAGSGTVDATSETPKLAEIASNGSKYVTLDCCDDATDKHPEIAPTGSMDFYLAVAPFSGKQLKIKVMTEKVEDDGKYKYIFSSTTTQAGGLSLDRNEISSVSMSLKAANRQALLFYGAGTKDCPYLITSADDLIQLCTLVNSSDATVKSTYNTNQIHYLQTATIPLSSWSTSIGNGSTKSFSANYDGGGYSINGINGVALFGYAGAENSPNTIKNLTVSGELSTNSYYDRGGLVNNNQPNTHLIISHCTTDVDIKCSYNSTSGVTYGRGGIIGSALGIHKVEYCESQGDILCNYTGSDAHRNRCNYGGIIGYATGQGNVVQCSNTGNIGSDPATETNRGNRTGCYGGIVGRVAVSDYTIDGCKNHGTIYHTGNQAAYASGGIVGRVSTTKPAAVDRCTIRNCENCSDATVSGINGGAGANTFMGGICGHIYGGTGHIIEDCINNGTVSYNNSSQFNASVGGIIGQLGVTSATSIDIINCSNNNIVQGSSTSTSYSGGIIGYVSNLSTNEVNIINCINTDEASVKRGQSVGGIVGYARTGDKSLQIYNSYSSGDIETSVGTSYAGGIIGRSGSKSTNGLATNCYSVSDITLFDATGFMGAIAGQVSYGTDIVDCYGILSASYGKRINSGTAGYTQFTSYGTIDAVTTALCTRLNDWVSTNNGEGSTYKTWQQSVTAGNPTEYPHF